MKKDNPTNKSRTNGGRPRSNKEKRKPVHLTAQQKHEILAAGIPEKHLPALEKGKPYVIAGALITYRMVGGKLRKDTYRDAKQQASDLYALRNRGVPMSKACLRFLEENGYKEKLSDQERGRLE